MNAVQERWVVSDGNDGHLFNAFVRAMNFYGLLAEEMVDGDLWMY